MSRTVFTAAPEQYYQEHAQRDQHDGERIAHSDCCARDQQRDRCDADREVDEPCPLGTGAAAAGRVLRVMRDLSCGGQALGET